MGGPSGGSRTRPQGPHPPKMLELGFTISMKDESRYMKEVFVRAMSVPMKKATGTTTRSIFRSSAPLPPPQPPGACVLSADKGARRSGLSECTFRPKVKEGEAGGLQHAGACREPDRVPARRRRGGAGRGARVAGVRRAGAAGGAGAGAGRPPTWWHTQPGSSAAPVVAVEPAGSPQLPFPGEEGAPPPPHSHLPPPTARPPPSAVPRPRPALERFTPSGPSRQLPPRLAGGG